MAERKVWLLACDGCYLAWRAPMLASWACSTRRCRGTVTVRSVDPIEPPAEEKR